MLKEELTAPRMEIAVDDQKMNAVLRLRGRYSPDISFESVTELLNDYGITYGVDSSAIHRIVDLFQKNGSTESTDLSETIARGLPVKQGENGRIEILVENPTQVVIDEDGRADYRNVEKYRTVEADQVVMKLFPATEGTSGINIYNEPVPADPVENPRIEIGRGIKRIPNTFEYAAAIKGIFIHTDKIIDVNAVLEIQGNVGLESGNVNYDGSVRIYGNIERGSSVMAAGDVEVGGLIESGEIKTGGSLLVRKGINARRENTIEIEGDLKAVFIDNSLLTVHGNINVEKSIVGSGIICFSDIYLNGRASTISGGEFTAFGSVTADIIGNRNETPTKIVLGEHYQNQVLLDLFVKEKEHLEKDYEKVSEMIAKIKNFVQRSRGNVPADKKAEFRLVFQKYKQLLDKNKHLEEKIAYYRANRYNKSEVKLTARDTLFPGVEIHYRGYVEKIRAPQTKCVLRFIPGMEKPKIEAYVPSKK